MNNLKFSIRNLKRQKGYLVLNILGLGIGISISLLIATFVIQEFQTDRFHTRLERIYRFESDDHAHTPSIITDFIQTILPEALEICRLGGGSHNTLVNFGGKQFRIGEILYADSSFFDIFSFPFIYGDPLTALADPLSIVLSESEAQKLFGEQHPIGKTLKVNNHLNYRVTGIMKDIPAYSSIKASAIVPFHSLALQNNDPNILKDWNNWNYNTFVLLPPNHDIYTVNQKVHQGMLREIEERYGFKDVDINFFLRPFSEIYLSREKINDSLPKGNFNFIMIYIAIGIFILFIAVVNYINLGTALAFRRSLEVGLRKVFGSSKGSLIKHYLTESIIVCFISLAIALALYEILLPQFNLLTASNIQISILRDPGFITILFAFTLLLGIISGIYPALYLTRFQPVVALKGDVTKGKKGSFLRKILIVFQFIISIGIIFATIVIYSQMNFAQKMDHGIQRENIIFFSSQGQVLNKYDAFKNEIKKIPGVQHVGISSSIPGYVGMNWGRPVNGEEYRMAAITVDPEFLDVYDLKIVEGRGFEPSIITDINSSYIINETAVRHFNLKEPLNATLANGRIIGVVRDFSYLSAHHPIGPLVIAYLPEWCHYINIRIDGHNVPQVIDQIKHVWQSFEPDFPFSASFFDQSLGRLYQKEARLSKLFLFFSILAIFIACLGLSGLAIVNTQKRTKEVGIRKVLGSSQIKIVLLLTGGLLKEIFIAGIIALPITWFLMDRWLSNFAFRISISWWMFIASASIVIIIALATTIAQALKAASIQPAISLKYE